MIAALLAFIPALVAIAEGLAALVAVAALLDLVFDPKGKQRIGQLIANITGGALLFASQLLSDLESQLSPVATAFVSAFDRSGGDLLNIVRDPARRVAEQAFNDIEANLTASGPSTPDTAVFTAASAIGEAFGFGIGSHAVTVAFEAALPEKLNTLNGVGPMLSELAGFKEVTSNILDPLYEAAFGKSLQYHYRSIFKPELPREGDAVLWHARRLLSDTQLRAIFNYSGLKPEYETAFVESAYRSIQPRALTTLFEDTPFPRDQVQSMLEFYGARPHDIPILLDAYEHASTKNVRHQYLSSLLIAAERGTLDQATLDSHLDGLDFSAQAKNYVHLTVALRRLEQLAELYRKSITTLYETGQLTDAQYVPALEAIGIAKPDAEAHYAIDSARLRGKALAEAERAQDKDEARTLSAQIAALRDIFLDG